MKIVRLIYFSMAAIFLILITNCNDREVTNPFDANCPKELFTPSDLKAEQEGTSVKLNWKQENTQITGFIISRNENDGAMSEVARVEKTVLTWNDATITGGKKYGYQLVAYAAENLSNAQKVTITPVTGAVVITASAATELTPFSAVLVGNVTGDGGATVTERGICYGTSQNPTTSTNKLTVGNGTGEFSNTITNLTANTTYYARAYAINKQGTTYGNQITFSTPQIQLSVTPAIYDVPKGSGSRVFTVTSNIDWQVTSDQTWCKPNISDGKGISPVVAVFETNTTAGQRSATLTFSAIGISNQIVVITQAGAEPPVLTILPDNQNVTNEAGTTSFAITSNVSWTAQSDQTWCTITNTSGVGDAILTINYEANTTNSQRIANLEITGLDLSVKTVNVIQQYITTVTDIDGNIYQTVTIGEQVWMAENLAYLPRVSPSSAESNTTPFYYVYGYQGSSVSEAKTRANYSTYGVLYNWPAAMNGATSSAANPSGVQGVCPTGWHLPSEDEWKQLTDYLGGDSMAAGKLKETGTSHWFSPNIGATNETGFTALPGSYRAENGTFDATGGIGSNTYWWSATQSSSANAYYPGVGYSHSKVIWNAAPKEYGFSVRCVKD